MAHGFRRHKGSYVARLGHDEREALISLMSQVQTLLQPAAVAEERDEFEAMMRGAGLTRLGDELPDAPPPEHEDEERDPALERLLPDAHREDPLVAAEFRRMSAPGLRARKAANLAAAIACLAQEGTGRRGDELRLGEGEAQALLVALTDVRLVVGERLELHTDADADRLESELAEGVLDAETAWLVAVYDFLTWLQEGLSQALLTALGPGGQDDD